MKRWNIRQQNIQNKDGDSLACRVSAARGIGIADAEISAPFLMADMEKAAEIIKTALYDGEKIVVFGDYDCDGIIGTVILCRYLTAQGGEVTHYIPSREDGYGLNKAAIDELIEKGAELIITVDNGISCAEEAAYIKSHGVKLIITDHHTVPSKPEDMPPADAVINPKRADDTSPFKDLAGCGVVLKLIMAIEEDIEGVLDEYADLAAIGTIGDVVPLLGENRAIVKRGLDIMPYTENIGLYKLLRQSGFSLEPEDNDRSLTANALSFTICPRINAAGRFAHANLAVELLLTENEQLAELRSAELTELNNRRRDVEREITEQINALFAENPALACERTLFLTGNSWHHGVIGIISSRVLQKWGKPNFIISVSDDGINARGSGRSVEGFPLMPLLDDCKELLEKYGGHAKAAGVNAKSENLEKIKEKISAYCALNYPDMPFDALNIDAALEPGDLTTENAESLGSLAPFGESNPIPLFLMQNCVIISKKPLKNGKYLSFDVKMGEKIQKILNFNCTYDDFGYNAGQTADVLVTLDVNEYNGVRSVSATLKDIRPSGFNQERYFAALRAYEKLTRGEEIDSALAARALPEKDDIKIVYDILRVYNNINAESLYNEAAAKGLNYCKFRIILDVLSELGLIEHNIINNKVCLTQIETKTDLNNSRILNKMKVLAGI